ncbi:MAG: hypothetical protein Q9227_009308 [Pyrenula ochraceoflavens]
MMISPIEKAWDKKLDGHCISIGGVWYGNSVMTILTDLAIIILPVREILRLNMPMAQKLGLAMLFSLGFFVMACTIVRMITVGPAITKTDTLHYQAISNSWTFLEVNVGIICACLPVLKSLLLHFFPRLFRSTRNAGSSGYGYAHSSNNKPRSNSHHHNLSSSRYSTHIVTGKPGFSTTTKATPDHASDEEIMLGGMQGKGMGGIQKKSDVRVSWAMFDPEKDLPIQGGKARDSL